MSTYTYSMPCCNIGVHRTMVFGIAFFFREGRAKKINLSKNLCFAGFRVNLFLWPNFRERRFPLNSLLEQCLIWDFVLEIFLIGRYVSLISSLGSCIGLNCIRIFWHLKTFFFLYIYVKMIPCASTFFLRNKNLHKIKVFFSVCKKNMVQHSTGLRSGKHLLVFFVPKCKNRLSPSAVRNRGCAKFGLIFFSSYVAGCEV